MPIANDVLISLAPINAREMFAQDDNGKNFRRVNGYIFDHSDKICAGSRQLALAFRNRDRKRVKLLKEQSKHRAQVDATTNT